MKGSQRGLVRPTVAELTGRLRKKAARKGGRQTFDYRNTNEQRGRLPGSECASPDISYPFCCDLLRARLAALVSRSSTDCMFPYSPTPNRFAPLARRALAASRDENV